MKIAISTQEALSGVGRGLESTVLDWVGAVRQCGPDLRGVSPYGCSICCYSVELD
jgi:hypothetical protein